VTRASSLPETCVIAAFDAHRLTRLLRRARDGDGFAPFQSNSPFLLPWHAGQTGGKYEEGVMNFVKATAAVAFAAVVFAGSSAFAQERANTMGCLHASKQVSDALAANPQSPNSKDASDEQRAGREFCMNGVYDRGVAHYEKALDLLSADKH
jgi:hypothetical protein